MGGQLLDVLIRDRGSSTTVVTFQHRVSVRTPYPTLVGEGFTGKANVNLVAISDPSVSLGGEVRLGWYLGNRAIGHLEPILEPVIEAAIQSLGTERLIFFGNSGGGYPALKHAAMHPGSIGFCVNPRLGFNDKSTKDFADYMSVCHPGLGRTAYRRVYSEYARDLVEILPKEANFYAAMYHNRNDLDYYNSHHRPFVEARRHDLRIFERLENDEHGHTPIPKERLVSIISELANHNVDIATALQRAGFSASAVKP